ncbi:MAG: amidohydrolase [Chloroflexota bacterium]|nr:amidohydrolase [Chloroflexota bacterium]
MDLLLTNGIVRTMDSSGTVAEAIAIGEGTIRAIGTDSALSTVPAATVIDLGGKAVIPGLIDGHTHLEGTATHLAYFADCHVPPHRDIPGILGALREHADAHPEAEWVIGQGSFMLREKLLERRYPTLSEMDEAVPDRPALIRAGAHISIVNSAALERVGVDKPGFKLPTGAHIERDSAGKPTGMLVEMYWSLGLGRFSAAETESAIERLARQFSAYGITSVQDQFPSAAGLRAYQRLRREGRFPLRISFTVHTPTPEAARNFVTFGFESGFGDDFLKFGAAKFFVDGGITGAAGAFYDDYSHQPGNKGHLKLQRDEVFEMVRLLDDAGIQISTHVVGDLALDTLLDAYEAHPASWGKRHRLEHAGHLCMNEERISRMKGMGLVPVVTMPFLNSFGDFLPEYLGDRAQGAFALRRLLDAGLTVPGSSDSLGAQPESLNPWFGMWCSVARETYLGGKLAPEEAVSPLEALGTYTFAPAWADHAEHVTGTLEIGKAADLVVLDRDPATMDAAALKEVRPLATLLAGEVVSGALLPEGIGD